MLGEEEGEREQGFVRGGGGNNAFVNGNNKSNNLLSFPTSKD